MAAFFNILFVNCVTKVPLFSETLQSIVVSQFFVKTFETFLNNFKRNFVLIMISFD